MEYAIETQNLTRRYGVTTALDGVTINVPADTITGVLGRNGAGKTTLMSLITAQETPTSGRVRVLGEAPFEHARVLDRLCFIRDNQRYPDDYKLKHTLRAAAIFYPQWDVALAHELVELFRIPSATVVAKLSRGQLSALGIVIGLASRAPVTFFDEPYLGLDATARSYFYDTLLREYQAYPRTIVLSTHLIDEMERLLERVVILDRGRVVKDASVEDLRSAAHLASGTVEEVRAYAAERRVLSRHVVGGLESVVIEGVPGRATGAIEIGPVSLQTLVAAYGAYGAGDRDSKQINDAEVAP